MTRLSDPDDTDPGAAARFNFSPDRRYVAIVKRKGNVTRNSVTYWLEIFETERLRRAVTAPSSELPQGRALASFETASPRKAIEQVRWLADGTAVTFVGRSSSGSGRGYVAYVNSAVLHRITPEQYDVLTFDYSPTCQQTLFAYEFPPPWRDRASGGHVTGSQQMAYLAKRSPLEVRPLIGYRLINLRAQAAVEVQVPNLESWWGFPPARPALSLDCTQAIIHIGVDRIPDSWLKYDLSGSYPARTTVDLDVDNTFAELTHNEAFGRPAPWIGQFHVVDLKTGHSQPLFDAPSGWSFMTPQAQWLNDGSGVIVGPTYLPSSDLPPKAASITNQIIAHADLRFDKAHAITPVVTGDVRNPYLWASGFSVNSRGNLRVERRNTSGAASVVTHTRRNGVWSQHRSSESAPGGRREAVRLAVRQDVNTPPEIVGTDPITGRRRVLTSLNPQLRTLRLGRVIEFLWVDSADRRFTGGLVFPSDYRADQRYPLVVQTYGFNPRQFLVDGAGDQTTAYAAQPLAGRGLLVLQMPGTDADPVNNARTREQLDENTKFQFALEGALDALNERRLIDPGRVGLIGFSREGMHVEHFVTFSRYPIVAATISDSVAASPFCYAQMFGQPYPGMVDIESLIGAPFWEEGIELWMKRSYIFHLNRITAALRFEHIGTDFVPCHWDAYALLKRHERPAEMIHIPFDEHSLQTPAGRLASQAENVQWFAFWLKGDTEGLDGEKRARWQGLREQRNRIPPLRREQ